MKNYLKKNKGLFLLPLGLIPFLVLIFYVLGGGKNSGPDAQLQSQATDGANYILPEAEKSIEIFDKMEAYQMQGSDNDMVSRPDLESDSINQTVSGSRDSVKVEIALLAQQNENLPEDLLAHIKQKEQEVRKEMAGPEQKAVKKPEQNKQYTPYKPKPVKAEKKAEKEQVRQSAGIEELDKVFDENMVLNRQNDSLKFYLEQSRQRLAEMEKVQNAVFSLEKAGSTGFNKDEGTGQLIKAEIYETTTVLDGNRVKLRLLEDTRINESKVLKNTFIYAICRVKNERLHMEISQVPVGDGFLPVKLAIYDLDGMPGLYVPDNVARRVSKEVGAGTNTSSIMGESNNPLAYAGIRAADRTAQTLIKRVRLKKVTIKKNTLVYLINKN